MSPSELTNESEAPSSPSAVQPKQDLVKPHRTLRACDRCRFKKSKCNGHQPCRNCSSSDRICVYSARRRRDARNWYCNMQETLDEAIQRLYRACKASNSFPGTLPEELDDHVTTESILHGLGLRTAPAAQGATDPQNLSPPPHTDSPDGHAKTLDTMDDAVSSMSHTGSNEPQRPTYTAPGMSNHHQQQQPQQPQTSSYARAPRPPLPSALDMCSQFTHAMEERNNTTRPTSTYIPCTSALPPPPPAAASTTSTYTHPRNPPPMYNTAMYTDAPMTDPMYDDVDLVTSTDLQQLSNALYLTDMPYAEREAWLPA